MPQQSVSHYRILKKLGAGGMGEVYLAEDNRLDRKVALKLLPQEFTQDAERLRRFTREAKAASALNHPNIITIYDIGQTDSSHFIATEYVEGDTLRQHLRQSRMAVSEVLEVAVQVADALSEAHQTGIIHRDIKPENLIVKKNGLVKLLDFGLAKLTERKAPSADTSAPTAAQVNTGPNVILGTLAYMSPEQARGKDLDARTDIFSFGVLLYEMVTGHAPFEGETTSDVIAAILKSEPGPISSYSPDAPPELQRIIGKALRKDRDERYQTMKDLLLDLKSLRGELKSETKSERPAPADSSSGNVPTTAGAGATTAAEQGLTTDRAAAGTTSSAEYIVTGIKRHKFALLILLVVVAAAIVVVTLYLHARDSEVAVESIAVMPFDNQSHDPDVDYLSDGMTESIINNLTQLPNLRVIARSTVFRYKGKETDPLAVGKELGVRAVLVGRLVQRGDSLTISAELLDVRDNKQIWGEQYGRKVSDALAMQQEISREITDRLRLELTGEERRQIAHRGTGNAEAYQLYLRGRHHWNKRTQDGINKALDYFRQATLLDPNYALAYVGLADCYNLLTDLGGLAADKTFPKAKEAARKALLIDDTLAEAHTSLAYCLMNFDNDWSGSEKEYRRAIDLNPNYPTARQWYGEYLTAVGRLDEALSEALKAQQLDPLSLPINARLGMTLFFRREYNRAITQLQKTLEIEPGYRLPHIFLYRSYVQLHMYDQAIAEQAGMLAVGGPQEAEGLLNRLRAAYQAGGEQGLWRELIVILTRDSSLSFNTPIGVAEAYTLLGQKDRAFEWLTRAVDAKHPGAYTLKVDPIFDPLRSDPRFTQLLARVGLPQ